MCPAVAEPSWLSGQHGTTLGWWSVPAAPTGRGVLLLPALGYEYSTSHRTWRTLAEQLAERGSLALRLDHPGTADSTEPADGVTGIEGWRAAVHTGVQALRDAGASSVSLVGIRWGATLALLEAEAVGAEAVLALAPVVSGKRYVRELKLLGESDADGSGDVSVGGSLLTAAVLASMATVTVSAPAGIRVRSFDKPGAMALPGDVERTEAPSLIEVLDRPAEDAVMDQVLVAEAADWLCPASPAGRALASLPALPSAQFTWRGTALEETVVNTGPLVGVLTRCAAAPSRDLLVFLNSGSDPHSGPGRAWVDLARDIATPDGWSSLRVDATGWGESPDGPSVPGRPYDRHMTGDLTAAVAMLHASGQWDRVVLTGLCAGAWVALQVARDPANPVAGVIALNAQLYWQYGDPVMALLAEAIAYRAPTAAFEAEQAALGRWDAEDEQGVRPPSALWLDELAAAGRPITLLFTGSDPGLEYVNKRIARRLASAVATGVVSVVEVPELDHGLQRTWLRPLVVGAYRAALEHVRA